MSPITSLSSRGSVLMEFVMVLPIYLVVMGAIFTMGEMGLRAIGLTTSDRASAFDTGRSGEWESFSHSEAGLRQFDGEGSENLSCWGNTYRTNALSFKGAWSWLAGGMSSYKYSLPSWTQSWLFYPHSRFCATTGTDPSKLEGTLGQLLYETGFDVIVSKETERRYTYYTLKRTDLARSEDAYRHWNPKYLTASDIKNRNDGETGIVWYDKVYNEGYADSNHLSVDGLMDAAQGKDSFEGQKKRSDYDRFFRFMMWSQ